MAVIFSRRWRLAVVVGGAMFAGAVMGGAAVAYQPHMHNALRALEAARAQLGLALPDKAGYRVQAESLVEQAISAVDAGIAAGAH